MDCSYLVEKRQNVLAKITPICNVFGIKDFDYIVDTDKGSEWLKLNDTLIGCCSNSESAVVDELIGYLFVKIYCHNRYIGAFRTQTLNVVRQYWKKPEAAH